MDLKTRRPMKSSNQAVITECSEQHFSSRS